MNTRREFIQTITAGSLTALLNDYANALPVRKGTLIDPSKKLRIASIGSGGKGFSDIMGVRKEQIVALCDVDPVQAERAYSMFPEVPKYKDFRTMLEEMDDQIDAVTVSTPDHMHYSAGMAAIERGKHIFIQKPLAHSIWEVRELTRAARQHEVVSAMGNQGHAKEGVRLVKEWIQGGVLGDVREVHIWTQKLTNGKYRSALRDQPASKEVRPEALDWNLWIGTAPMTDYSAEIHPRRWRGWWDFGNGALGDIGCHTMDAAFYALELGAPSAVSAQSSGYNPYTFPDWSIVNYEFPARGEMPPVKLIWYDGGKLPERPKELEGQHTFETKHGYIIYGDKATLYDPTEKCEEPRIIPESKRLALKPNFPPKSIPRVPEENNFQEWVTACKGGPNVGSNFNYAGPLSEMVLLGNVALRAEGKRIEWDPEHMRISNFPELNTYINTPRRKY